jgi:hypothetical protein
MEVQGIGDYEPIQKRQIERVGEIGRDVMDLRVGELYLHRSFLLSQRTPVAIDRENFPIWTDEIS